MSHSVNDSIKDAIRELYELVTFLESELECAVSQNRVGDADQVAAELYDARKELAQAERDFYDQ